MRRKLFVQSSMPVSFTVPPGGGSGGNSAAYTNFIARTSLTSPTDDTYINAYKDLLNGLTTDGLFNSDGTSNFFDALYIFATKNSATALLNLVNSSFAATNPQSLTFTASRGFTGDTINTHYIDTNFNASTASSPLYSQNSAHMSAWVVSDPHSGAGEPHALVSVASGAAGENIFPQYNDGNFYGRLNDNPESGGFAIANPTGHSLINRSTSTARQGYRNASSVGAYGSVASQAPLNSNFSILGNSSDSADYQAAMASFGSSMNSAQVTNFYNRLRTYMTVVGVP